ncbi:hypothetical protein [Pseudonocardia oroxyli]|nr:hypothetical protein [Pseudonocardia oroxyli]
MGGGEHEVERRRGHRGERGGRPTEISLVAFLALDAARGYAARAR